MPSRPAATPVSASDVIEAYETVLAAEERHLAGLGVLASPDHVIGRVSLVEAHLTIARALRETAAVMAAKPNREEWSEGERALYAALAISDEVDRLQVADKHEDSARVLCGGGDSS
jgi:hypothetical protein